MTAAAGVSRALEANVAAYDALRGGLRPGMTETDAYELVREAVDRVCGAESHEFAGDFVGGRRTGGIEGPPTDLVLREGDLFICDLLVRRGDWWSDTCRTFFLGEPSSIRRAAYEALLECMKLGEGMVRPGVVCADVKTAAEDLLFHSGFAGRMPHHVGHLVGPEPFYEPSFVLDDRSVVREGWVCTLEPGVYFSDSWGMRVENDYLVTADGLVNLFDYPRALESFVLAGKDGDGAPKGGDEA